MEAIAPPAAAPDATAVPSGMTRARVAAVGFPAREIAVTVIFSPIAAEAAMTAIRGRDARAVADATLAETIAAAADAIPAETIATEIAVTAADAADARAASAIPCRAIGTVAETVAEAAGLTNTMQDSMHCIRPADALAIEETKSLKEKKVAFLRPLIFVPLRILHL